jgi:hypothetical protein
MQPRVLVSHSGRQHVHQLVYALQEAGYLQKFITSVWYKPGFPYTLINLFPPKLKKITERELKKRYCEDVEKDFVEQFPFFEIVREGVDRLLKGYKNELGVYLGNRIHDFYVARRIKRLKPDIIIGYETSSSRTFKRAGSLNVIRILDLAQVHYRFLNEIRRKYTEYDRTFDSKISSKVNMVKNKELTYADYVIALSDLVRESLIKYGVSRDKI